MPNFKMTFTLSLINLEIIKNRSALYIYIACHLITVIYEQLGTNIYISL